MDKLTPEHRFRASLVVMAGRYAVCSLPPGTTPPPHPGEQTLWSATYTRHEVSLVLPEEEVQPGWTAERGWRCFEVLGPLSMSLTGVLSALAAPLAGAGIPIYAVSTYHTDYLMVKDADLERAVGVLRAAGHQASWQQ